MVQLREHARTRRCAVGRAGGQIPILAHGRADRIAGALHRASSPARSSRSAGARGTAGCERSASGHAATSRGLGGRHLFDLAQNEGNPLGKRQPVHRGRQPPPQLVAVDVRFRVVWVRPIFQAESFQGPLASERRPPVAAHALDGNPQDERLQPGVAAEGSGRVGQGGEHVLHDILGGRVVGQQPPREHPHALVPAVERRGQDGQVARAQPDQQPSLPERRRAAGAGGFRGGPAASRATRQ